MTDKAKETIQQTSTCYELHYMNSSEPNKAKDKHQFCMTQRCECFNEHVFSDLKEKIRVKKLNIWLMEKLFKHSVIE